MNRSEAARLLRVSEDTLERWVRQGLLRPADRGGKRFERAELARWARERGLRIASEGTTAAGPSDPALLQALERGAVVSGVQVSEAAEAIRVAVDSLHHIQKELRARLLEKVLERERMASTAVGQGIAIPHPRQPLGEAIQEPVVSLLFLASPVDWVASDGELVHTVALLAAPTAAAHLEILSQVGRALGSPQLLPLLREHPTKAALSASLRSLLAEKRA